MLVYSGDPKVPSEPGLWRLHKFQLHCLTNGFLSNRYPYWADGLQRWTRAGQLAQSGKLALPDAVPGRCLAHMRLGDCASLKSAQVSQLLETPVPGFAFAANRFFTETDYRLYQMGMFNGLPARHYAERGARQVDPETFATTLGQVKADHSDALKVIFATDGYSRFANTIAEKVAPDAETVEQALNRQLDPVCAVSDTVHIGEDGDSLYDVLHEIAAADLMVTTSSLFVPTVKVALSGIEALERWTVVDQADSLSEYLQLPSVVPYSYPLYSRRLRRLLQQEPVPDPLP